MSEDYQAIPGDLIRLGFVPPGQEAMIQRAGVVEALSVILKQLAQGGGPKKVQERFIKQIKDEFGDIPREELREKMQAKFEELNRCISVPGRAETPVLLPRRARACCRAPPSAQSIAGAWLI